MSIIVTNKRHLYLAGFMGTGKSAVGGLVARQMSREFYDLDNVIVSMAGISISEIFRTRGEEAFRQLESKELRSIVVSAGAVIALGGGAPTKPLIADIMRRTGRTVLLTASWPAIWQRIKDDASRPLVAPVTGETQSDSPDRFERFVMRADLILESRRSLFNSIADHIIDTTDLTLEAVANQVVTWWNTPDMETRP